jgi:hypothetical protein
MHYSEFSSDSQTPDKLYFGSGDHIPNEFEAAHKSRSSSRVGCQPGFILRTLREHDAGIYEHNKLTGQYTEITSTRIS